jgi:hypothetical protein
MSAGSDASTPGASAHASVATIIRGVRTAISFAHHLRPFGHEEPLLAARLLVFERAYQLDFSLANHIAKLLISADLR